MSLTTAERRGRTIHYVYVARDSFGAALYVGCTNAPTTRFQDHRKKSWWAEVATVDLHVQPDFQTARLAEADLIAELNPPHNLIGTDREPEHRATAGAKRSRTYRARQGAA